MPDEEEDKSENIFNNTYSLTNRSEAKAFIPIKHRDVPQKLRS
jgi:hypothetical protein